MEENMANMILYERKPVLPRSEHPFIFGQPGAPSKLRAYPEDEFDPKLVPSYVKEIKIETYSEGKRYFCYIDDYGQSQGNN